MRLDQSHWLQQNCPPPQCYACTLSPRFWPHVLALQVSLPSCSSRNLLCGSRPAWDSLLRDGVSSRSGLTTLCLKCRDKMQGGTRLPSSSSLLSIGAVLHCSTSQSCLTTSLQALGLLAAACVILVSVKRLALRRRQWLKMTKLLLPTTWQPEHRLQQRLLRPRQQLRALLPWAVHRAVRHQQLLRMPQLPAAAQRILRRRQPGRPLLQLAASREQQAQALLPAAAGRTRLPTVTAAAPHVRQQQQLAWRAQVQGQPLRRERALALVTGADGAGRCRKSWVQTHFWRPAWAWLAAAQSVCLGATRWR